MLAVTKFDLEDFRDQLQQMNNMGGITGLLDKLPGMGNMAKMAKQNLDMTMFKRMEGPRPRRGPNAFASMARSR